MNKPEHGDGLHAKPATGRDEDGGGGGLARSPTYRHLHKAFFRPIYKLPPPLCAAWLKPGLPPRRPQWVRASPLPRDTCTWDRRGT
ncbi:hypothetical protein LX36DRAFT_423150 [Colletotrichum falcatum]|nr:hypothetical protein LX36DRAFT_423150 [Colletotrichum falcatum]